MKNRLLFGLSIVSFVSLVACAAVMSKTSIVHLSKSSGELYSLKMEYGKNRFTDSTHDVSGSATVKTNLGNDISFVYADINGDTGYTWQQVSPGGYFYNTSPLNGIETMKLLNSSGNNTFTVYWSNTTTFDDEHSIKYTKVMSSLTVDFNGEKPAYFKYVNSNYVTINIWSVELKYSCLSSYPTLSISSEDENKGTVSGTSGSVLVGTQATIVATPNEGYQFVGWYSGETLISSEASYSFTVDYGDMNYVAKFAPISYNLLISSENSTKGTVSNSSGSYPYLSNVSISANANEGYTFDGWYSGDNLVSSSNPYNFLMPHNDINYIARFTANSYTLSISTSDTSFGTVSGSGTYQYGSSVTAIASPFDGAKFTGWYDENDALVSSLTSYTFDMPASDYALHAVFYGEIYTLTVSSENNSYGVASGSGSKIYGSSVTATCYEEGGRFKGWYDFQGNLVSVRNPYTFTMPRKNYELTAKFMNAAELYEWKRTHGVTPIYDSQTQTISYGLYPQNHVSDIDLLEILDTLTLQDSRGWYCYDNEYYVKLTAYTANASGSSFDDGTPITRDTEYWFRCDPIVWKVLKIVNGDYYALSTLILDGWYYVYSSMERTIDNTTVYPSNYKYSGIRTWLNGTFFDTAFANSNKTLIQLTDVDNSASTTHNNSNEYACANTSDKVFLPSYKDYLNSSYGFSTETSASVTRECQVSEYARADYTYEFKNQETLHNGSYLTRSPFNASNVWQVSYDGSLYSGMGYSYTCGVRPAVTLRLS